MRGRGRVRGQNAEGAERYAEGAEKIPEMVLVWFGFVLGASQPYPVIPAQAGIHSSAQSKAWIPACAGMTVTRGRVGAWMTGTSSRLCAEMVATCGRLGARMAG